MRCPSLLILLAPFVSALACNDATAPTSRARPEIRVPQGTLVIPSTTPQVSARGAHTCALKADAAVVCWGDNSYGQATVPAGLGPVAQVSAGGYVTCALGTDGRVVCWGDNRYGQATVPAGLFAVAQVSTGSFHNCALRTDGTVVCWGDNEFGQSSVPAGLGPIREVSAGTRHTCALKEDKTVACWGAHHGATILAGLSSVVQLSSDAAQTCALKTDGTVTCWGGNDAGQASALPGLTSVAQVSVGFFHECALKTDGTVVCSGYDAWGQVTVPSGLTEVTQVSAGGRHTCALKRDGSVVCWGQNTSGEATVPAGLNLTAPPLPRSNQAPVAVIRAPDRPMEGAHVRLDARESTDPEGGPLTFEWSFGDGATSRLTEAWVDHVYDDNGEYVVKLIVRDDRGLESVVASTRVSVSNVAPTATLVTPESVSEGSSVAFSLEGPSDASTRDVDAGLHFAFSCTDAEGYADTYAAARPTSVFNCTAPAGPSTMLVRAKVFDKDGGMNEYAVGITVTAVPGLTPPGASVVENPLDNSTGGLSAATLTFENVDAGGTTTLVSTSFSSIGGPRAPSGFSLGDPATFFDIKTSAQFSGSIGICISYSQITFSTASELRLLHGEQDGTWSDVTTEIREADRLICGLVGSLSPFLVAERNVRPVITSLVLPGSPIALGAVADVSAKFSDPNQRDRHTFSVSWDDGSTSGGTVVENRGTGTANAAHQYSAAGVYTINATVSDHETSVTESSSGFIPAYLVVYDPSGAFVTGGGWINSPVAACTWVGCATDGSSVGKASFGFVSRYQRGATTPAGNTEFQFKAGNLTFASNAYQWLVVAGARAQYKGTGSINGLGNFGFLLTAIDGHINGDGTDKFRIKIWSKNTDGSDGAVVYDNQRGAMEDSNAATSLGGGAIVIHK